MKKEGVRNRSDRAGSEALNVRRHEGGRGGGPRRCNRSLRTESKVVEEHGTEFKLHTDVAGALEDAVVTSRSHPTLVHLVLDMFMVQSAKCHAMVSLVAQHGCMEDAATLARRLLELSVQAIYIGSESEEQERRGRAGQYLAYLWRQLPQRIKHRFPPHVRRRWTGIGRGYGRRIPQKAKRWGPSFFTMFEAIGSEALYRSDYALLSSIAHGSADDQVMQFSGRQLAIQGHDVAPILLVYSSRYYLATAEVWRQCFGILSDETFGGLSKRVLEWEYNR